MSNEVIFSLVQEEKAGEARPFFRQRISSFDPLTLYAACSVHYLCPHRNTSQTLL